MDKNDLKIILGFNVMAAIVFGILMIVGVFALITSHEITHKTINSYYGLDSQIVIQDNSFATKLTEPYKSIGQKNEVVYLQSLTEIVGYQLIASTIMVCLVICLGFGLVLIKMDFMRDI